MQNKLKINKRTSFFRHEIGLQLIYDIVNKRDHTDIASVACADGKEPISIVIFLENMMNKFTIDGFDISEKQLRKAKKGEYFVGSYTKHYEKILNYLTWVNDDIWNKKYLINKEISSKIKYFKQDIEVVKLPKTYDVIFLQNLLYHYNSSKREKILINVVNSMNKGGTLICETPNHRCMREYMWWMKDLEQFGFQRINHKQSTFFNTDKLYRKIN